MTLTMLLDKLSALLAELPDKEKIEASNRIRTLLHQHSPFREEPVDCIQWVPAGLVEENNYNPNQVAPPENRLLYTSLLRTGFTQPLVVWQDENCHYTLIDGFHRFSLARQRSKLHQRLHGYVPVVTVGPGESDRTQRIAATIRHNRARGQHQIQAMSAIVQELARLGWDDKKISTELGMDRDEVLRLKQISGLVELFLERDFSEAWTVE
ncbi:TPA: IbrB-like domain-containing protein [Citrobacter freundii]